jgi:hypothetical protein
MGKRVNSKSEHWPGSVVIADPMTLPQVEAVEAALEWKPEEVPADGRLRFTVTDKAILPAILSCVETWSIDGIAEHPDMDTLPLTPRSASHLFLLWLWGEILNVYSPTVAEPVPNE